VLSIRTPNIASSKPMPPPTTSVTVPRSMAPVCYRRMRRYR
jgi:hypothetical protein